MPSAGITIELSLHHSTIYFLECDLTSDVTQFCNPIIERRRRMHLKSYS